MLLQPKKKVVSWGNSHDIRKAKLSAQANRQKYSGTSHSEKNHHNNNWQTQPQRRYKKMQEETGIFDKHGRRVRPIITIQLENHSPRITRSLPVSFPNATTIEFSLALLPSSLPLPFS